jgi:parallel beta-helix repeat protein
MNKFYLLAPRAMMVLLFSTILSLYSHSQTWTIASCSSLGTTTYGPMYSTSTANATSRTAVIYPASQLSTLATKTLTDMYFNRTSTTGSMAGTPNFKIYLKEVSISDWGSADLTWDVSGATLVYDGNPASAVGSTSGWKRFALTSNFYYSGTQNLAVFFEYTNATASSSISWAYEYTAPCISTSNTMTTKYLNNTTGTLPTALTSENYRRPHIGFDYSSIACNTSPVGGNAGATPTGTLCSGTTVTLSLTGNSAGSGQTYRWQKGTSNAGPWTYITSSSPLIPATDNPSLTSWYRAELTCSSNIGYSQPVQVTIAAAFPGGTYTINSAVATGGNNFQTFAAALSAVNCGIAGPVIFNVQAGSGPYNEQVILPAIAGTSSTNSITFNGNGVTLSDNSAATSAERAVIKLNGADFVTFNNFVISTGAGSYGYGVQLLNDADNNTISNCTISTNTTSTSTSAYGGIIINSTATAITTSGDSKCDNNIISVNTVTGGYIGIALVADGSVNTITGNQVTGNTILDSYSSGVYLDGTVNALVEGNNIHRPGRTNSSASFYGINMDGTSNGAKISRNKIHDPFKVFPASTAAGYGVRLNACDATAGNENIISNNLVYDFYGATGNQNGILINSSDNVKIFYNTIALEDAAASCGCAARGIYVQSTAVVGLEIRNNIISLNRSGSGDKQGLFFEPTSVASYTINNNVYYLNPSVGGTGIRELARVGATSATGGTSAGGTSYSSLLAWQATSKDLVASEQNPGFSSAFVPSNVAVDNIGSAVTGITVDITGATRSALTPDPGAFEWSPSLPVVMLNFTGVISGTINKLSWVTSTEINNSGFELQRSVDGGRFTALAFIGSVAEGGNSTAPLSYNFNDLKPFSGTSYYRLKQVDRDGRAAYSNTVVLKRKVNEMTITAVYPNPAKTELNLVISSSKAATVTIMINDMMGKILARSSTELAVGENQQYLDISSLAAGTYIIKVVSANGSETALKRFVKQ